MTTTNELASGINKKIERVKDEQKRRSNVKKGLKREYKGWRENGGRHRYNVQPEHRKRERDRTELTLEGWEAGSNLSGGGSTHQQRSGKQSRTVYSLFCMFWTILDYFGLFWHIFVL